MKSRVSAGLLVTSNLGALRRLGGAAASAPRTPRLPEASAGGRLRLCDLESFENSFSPPADRTFVLHVGSSAELGLDRAGFRVCPGPCPVGEPAVPVNTACGHPTPCNWLLFNRLGCRSLPDTSPTFLLSERCLSNMISPFRVRQGVQEGIGLPLQNGPAVSHVCLSWSPGFVTLLLASCSFF